VSTNADWTVLQNYLNSLGYNVGKSLAARSDWETTTIAGAVGNDGPTHHGAFDLSYLRLIPNMIVMAPSSHVELQHMLCTALTLDGPSAIRHPRGMASVFDCPAQLEVLEVGRGVVLQEVEGAVRQWGDIRRYMLEDLSDAEPSPETRQQWRCASLPHILPTDWTGIECWGEAFSAMALDKSRLMRRDGYFGWGMRNWFAIYEKIKNYHGLDTMRADDQVLQILCFCWGVILFPNQFAPKRRGPAFAKFLDLLRQAGPDQVDADVEALRRKQHVRNGRRLLAAAIAKKVEAAGIQ